MPQECKYGLSAQNDRRIARKEIMNISDSSALRECTGCQMCAAVCPKDAIRITLDESGFYRPYVDSEKCVDCGLCTGVCYRFDNNLRITDEKTLLRTGLYAASVRDSRLLLEVTSGGVADLLAKELIREGYLCIGVGYDDTKVEAYHYVAHSSKETDGFRGSKYIQSYSYPAFKELVKDCSRHKYAVFGTPCQIYAVRRFLEKRGLSDSCILIDMFCHGCPSLDLWRKYQNEIKGEIGKSHFDAVEFRSKERGWGGFYVVVVVDGVKAFVSSPKKDGFYELFFSDQVLNTACSDCLLRSTMEYTDIRLGDFWGKKYAMNRKGVSAVSLISQKGKDLFERIKPMLDIEESGYSELLPYQSYGKFYHPDKTLREKLLYMITDPGIPLREAVALLHENESLTRKFKRHIKNFLYYLPASVTRLIRRYIA